MHPVLLFLHPYQTLLKWPQFPTGSSSSSHLAKFSAFRRKFEMRVHFWIMGPTSSLLFEWRLEPVALGDAFLFIAKARG